MPSSPAALLFPISLRSPLISPPRSGSRHVLLTSYAYNMHSAARRDNGQRLREGNMHLRNLQACKLSLTNKRVCFGNVGMPVSKPLETFYNIVFDSKVLSEQRAWTVYHIVGWVWYGALPSSAFPQLQLMI